MHSKSLKGNILQCINLKPKITILFYDQELTSLSRLTVQRAPGIFLPLPTWHWDYKHTQYPAFNVGSAWLFTWLLGIQPHANMASTLLDEHLPSLMIQISVK